MPDPSDRQITPLSTSFPLSYAPLYSRITNHELEEDLSSGGSKNYKLLAFRPGYALQASELNEIQEHFHLQMTLTINMYNNWITSSIPTLWQTASESTNGVGDGPAGDYAVVAPGWKGTTPLYPFDSPYVQGGLTNQVIVENVGGTISIRIRPGWYLTELVAENEPDDEPINGLKYWAYFNGSGSGDDIINVVPQTEGLTYVGFYVSAEYVYPEDDASLYDNSNEGNYNPNTGGAGRFKVSLNAIESIHEDDPSHEDLSKMIKIDPTDSSVRYMNNLLITTY